MTIFSGGQFSRMPFEIDGNTYSGCWFKQCQFVFEGFAPAEFHNCSFEECELHVKEGADKSLIKGWPWGDAPGTGGSGPGGPKHYLRNP